MNKGEGTTVLPPNMIQQTPSGKTIFPVFIRIELNTNKLPYEMNVNSARTPRSQRWNVNLGSPSSLQPGGAKGRPVWGLSWGDVWGRGRERGEGVVNSDHTVALETWKGWARASPCGATLPCWGPGLAHMPIVSPTLPRSRWSPRQGGHGGDTPTGTETEKSRIRFEELLTAQRTQPRKCAGDLQEAEKNHLGGQPFIDNTCYLRLKVLSHSATPHPSLKIWARTVPSAQERARGELSKTWPERAPKKPLTVALFPSSIDFLHW